MTGLAKLLIIISVLLVALATTGFAKEDSDELREIDNSADKESPQARRRELHWQRAGNYRRGKGGKGGAKGKSKSKGGRYGYGVPAYDGYDDDYLAADGGLDDTNLIYGDCLPYQGSWSQSYSTSFSSSSSDDRARERNLRGQESVPKPNDERHLKAKRFGKSKGKGGSKGGKGSKGARYGTYGG